MTYSKDISLQEHQAWLATNPPISKIREFHNASMADFYQACDNLTNIFTHLNTICNGK